MPTGSIATAIKASSLGATMQAEAHQLSSMPGTYALPQRLLLAPLRCTPTLILVVHPATDGGGARGEAAGMRRGCLGASHVPLPLPAVPPSGPQRRVQRPRTQAAQPDHG